MAIIKSIQNFFRDYFNVHIWVSLALIAAIVAALYRFNLDILNMTHGNYNIIDILFM